MRPNFCICHNCCIEFQPVRCFSGSLSLTAVLLQGQQPNGSSASAVFAHHAFANPQQLAGSPGGQQGPGGQAGALSQFDSSTAQAVHQMLAQHAAAQNRNSTNSGSGGVPPIDQLYNLHAPVCPRYSSSPLSQDCAEFLTGRS